VQRERLAESAGGLEVAQVQRLVPGVVGLPALPGPHQGVLEDRELVRIVADVIEQAEDEAGADRRAAHRHRPGDGDAALLAAHAWDQELPVVHRLGEAGELGAVADEVGAHGEDDVDRRLLLVRRFEEQAHEGRRLLVRVLDPRVALEAEELLELVDQQQHVVVLGDAGQTDRLAEAAGAAMQGGVDEGAVQVGDLGIAAQDLGGGEGGGEVADRVVAGPEDGDAPTRAGAGHEPAVQRGDQARADQGGLAAAGGADDGEEAGAAQAGEQIVDLALAAEEEVLLLRLEAAQTGERVEAHGRLCDHAGTPT
jgi:hypothetical protein